MFTWMCPQCGREVPPAYNECPDCAGKTAGTTAAPADGTAPPPAAPPRAPQPLPHTSAAVPTWLLALLFALVFVGVGGGGVWFFTRPSSSKLSASVESPAAKPGAKVNPLQKDIEATGVRFSKAAMGTVVTFVLVNHSEADIVGLAGNVTVWGRTQKSEEDAVGTFAFETSMGAQTSKELTLPFNTKLKMIELPDWQNVTVDVQITAPVAP